MAHSRLQAKGWLKTIGTLFDKVDQLLCIPLAWLVILQGGGGSVWAIIILINMKRNPYCLMETRQDISHFTSVNAGSYYVKISNSD